MDRVQFHHDGYRTGDPSVEPAHPSVADRPEGLPGTADVLVVGAGPAGLVLAAQLASFPDVRTVVVDRRDGPLEVGQADGVACRTVEMFETFGLADRLIAEGYQVNEVTFWGPDAADPDSIVRTGRNRDVEDGLSEMPHLIVNQARMLAHLRDHMARSASRAEPYYGLRAEDVRVDRDAGFPVTVTLRHATGVSTVRARYVVGCDGARSSVRAAIGRELAGDVSDEAWGVLDVLAVTDFPDIRFKCAIRSAAHGNILVVPREGGHLVRLYVELDPAGRHDATPETLVAAVNRILRPYTLDVRHVAWWSVYEVGQRLCDRFDDGGGIPRVFVAGDACHTHSAKAGQGMNVSMADAWNLGWKLATVLRGTSRPELLGTYSAERQETARELIEFDREFSARFSAGAPPDPEGFRRYFAEQGRFTAGVAVRYRPSMITSGAPYQHLATGFETGTRFHSAPVVRLADAKRLQLGHVARADGAWRLYVFADRDTTRCRDLCDALPAVLARFTPDGRAPDSVLDVRAVFQQDHRELGIDALPPVLLPRVGRFGLVDHEKAFGPAPDADVFDLRGVDRTAGCLVVVRPDQYVAHVLPLDAHAELAEFLSASLRDAP